VLSALPSCVTLHTRIGSPGLLGRSNPLNRSRGLATMIRAGIAVALNGNRRRDMLLVKERADGKVVFTPVIEEMLRRSLTVSA
jgi:hypothetical protein